MLCTEDDHLSLHWIIITHLCYWIVRMSSQSVIPKSALRCIVHLLKRMWILLFLTPLNVYLFSHLLTIQSLNVKVKLVLHLLFSSFVIEHFLFAFLQSMRNTWIGSVIIWLIGCWEKLSRHLLARCAMSYVHEHFSCTLAHFSPNALHRLSPINKSWASSRDCQRRR